MTHRKLQENSAIKLMLSTKEINMLLSPAEYLLGKLKTKTKKYEAWTCPEQSTNPTFPNHLLNFQIEAKGESTWSTTGESRTDGLKIPEREKAKVPLLYNIHQFSQATGGEIGHHDNELRPC